MDCNIATGCFVKLFAGSLMDDSAGRGAPLSHLVGNWGAQMKPERFGTLRDAFGLLFRRRFRFLKGSTCEPGRPSFGVAGKNRNDA